MKKLMLILTAGLFALAACDEKKTEEPSRATTATSAAVEPKNTAAPVAVTVADSDLSTPADFEETAEKAITKANYKAELATLETDIAKD